MGVIRSLVVHLSHLIPNGLRRNVKWTLGIPDAGASLEMLARKGFRPTHVIDIGAYVGDWTRMIKSIWPDAAVMMVEAQPAKRPVLEKVAAGFRGVELRNTLLSDTAGKEFEFNVDETGSSLLQSLDRQAANKVKLVGQRLDDVVAGTPFAQAQLVKIDVQGAEFLVMRGGSEAMRAAEVVMLEVSLIEEYAGQALFTDIVKFMDELGFAVHDICTIWRHTPTESTNEFDVIFVRRTSPLFDAKHYRFEKTT